MRELPVDFANELPVFFNVHNYTERDYLTYHGTLVSLWILLILRILVLMYILSHEKIKTLNSSSFIIKRNDICTCTVWVPSQFKILALEFCHSWIIMSRVFFNFLAFQSPLKIKNLSDYNPTNCHVNLLFSLITFTKNFLLNSNSINSLFRNAYSDVSEKSAKK